MSRVFTKFLSRLGNSNFSPRNKEPITLMNLRDTIQYNTISVRILDARLRRGPRNTLADSRGIVTRAKKCESVSLGRHDLIFYRCFSYVRHLLVNINSEMWFNYNYCKTVLGTRNIEVRARKRMCERGLRKRNVCICAKKKRTREKLRERSWSCGKTKRKRYI